MKTSQTMNKSTAPLIFVATGLDENDVRHATGMAASDPFGLLVEPGGRLHLLVSPLEASRAKKTCPRAIIHTPLSLASPGIPPPATLSQQFVALATKLGAPRVTVTPHFPIGVARALTAAGVAVEVQDAPPFPSRAIKTAREVAWITQAQEAAVAAMRAAIECIRAATIGPRKVLRHRGRILTAEHIKNVIAHALMEHQCADQGTIVAVGPQSARPHDTGSGPLRAGVPIVLDIFPRHRETGYWGDITRTVVRGEATPQVRQMYRAVHTAQRDALAMLRPGVELAAVHQTVVDSFLRAGFITKLEPPGRECGFIHSTGHGVGLDIHEEPRLSRGPGQLLAGHVVTVEPGLYYPGIGGVRIEDTVVITQRGYKLLASFPKKLEV